MSRHKHNFHCFNPVGGEGFHEASQPLEHHNTRLPRMPQHGMMTYHDLEQECYLCSAHRHAQTVEDEEDQQLPFYHTHPPYHHHPHQYVLRGPSRHEETYSANGCPVHHQRCNKKIVLVKNSDPSFRKTIVLHSGGLRNFGLFLEEVSELMQYHIRKLYTQDGYKIDSIQSLLQCPGVLVCAGREPSHPLIIENFEKTSSYKLPKLSGKSRVTENTDGNERLTAKTSTILPNIEDYNRVTKQSVSSDKSVPDGRDSADIVNSCPSSGESMREDDIEKRVCVNKDGSLSMEMKVRFRLPNDETLHWSTKVKKTVGRTYDHFKNHNDPNLAQVSDVNCVESQIRSADEACFPQQHQGHKEKPHCPYCCSHCQGYETWKKVSGTHDASQCNHTSCSSTSSHTVVSRKTVIERQTMSRSSEELTDQVVETGITECIEAAETVEFCTIERETCSPKCNAKPSTVKNADCTGFYNCPKNLDLKTAQESDQKVEEAGSATCASQTFKGDDEKDDGDDGSFLPFSNPDRQETSGSEEMDTGLLTPHQSQVSKDKTSKTSAQNIKLKTSKPSYICHCREPEGVQIEIKENTESKAGVEGQIQRHKSSAMFGKSDASCCSNKPGEIQKVEHLEEEKRSKSAMSINSNASTNCNSAVLDVTTEGFKPGDEKETKDRTFSSLSMKSSKSSEPEKTPHVQYKSEEEDDSEVRTQSSLSALSSVSAELRNIAQEASEEEDIQFTTEENENSEPNVKSVISEKSTGSRKSKNTGETTEKNLLHNQAEEGISLMSATSGRSSVSPTSRTSVRTTRALSAKSNISTKSRESNTPEVYVVKKSNIKENDNTEDYNELRPQSKLSVKSEKSVKSNISAKSNKCKTMEITHDERASSVVSEKAIGSKSVTPTEQHYCRDDGATVGRAGSAMSVKSGMSHTSAVSLKSETSHVSTTHSGNHCDERNDLHATPERSSCMSDKSTKSNISGRSSNLKGCDKLNKDNAANEEERGPSAMSVKSAISNETSESTFSKASGKFQKSKPSDSIADQNSRDYTEQTERAPSNMSAASVKSSKSHASAVCMKEDASEVCCNSPEKMLTEQEIEERSLSSMSVQLVKSNISLRSDRTHCSTCTQDADATDLFLQESEEIDRGKREANCSSAKSVDSQNERSASGLSAKSKKSKKSTKSTRSNTSNIGATVRPGEDTNEEAIQERVSSVLSVKSVKSTTSIESTKSKGSNHTPREKNSEMSGEGNEEELLQERPASRRSPVSERSVKSAERPHSVLSAKSNVSDIESVASAEISDKRDYEDETEQRAQSVLSTKTEQSTTSAKSTKSTEHDGRYENIANRGEILERAASTISARSEKSTNTNISTVSKRSKVAAGCLEVVYLDEGVAEAESEWRSVSSQSFGSTVSAKSNYSMQSANAEVEDCSMSFNERKKHEHGEERPPSSLSAKSFQSCVSETLIKSAGRTPSSLSAKSVKSNTTGTCSRRFSDESDVTEQTQTRAQSVLSTKTERSASSAKSNKSKGLDSQADGNLIEDEKHAERSPSNLSVKSEKSTKSNTSTGSKQSKVSKICLDKRDPENASEDQPSSLQLVRTPVSVKSNKSKCCIESPVAMSSDNSNPDNENDKETNIERAPSTESMSSVQSSVSKTSIHSDVTIASALSEKSHASVMSDLTNVSELSSGRPVLLDEVDCEDEEKTPSVISVKSLNSSISYKSAKSERMDREKHEERSSSNLSLKSGRSAKSNSSKRSDIYEVQLENNSDYSDVRIVEGESEESTISVVSAQSVKSQCERFDNKKENSKRPPSSSSAKSFISNISEKSANSAERPRSASSARSVKSVQPNTSDAKSGKTVEICDTGTESQERTNSALSSKTEKSTTSTKCSKVKEHQSPTEENYGEHGDRNPSSMSTRSVTLPKSNVSQVSEESKASAVTYDPTSRSENNDGSQEEDSESRSMSSMSIHSVKSDISARSGMLKFSTDIPVQEIRARSDSPASVISIKSNSSGVFSDINPTGEITDEKPSQDRSESAISAKSTFSKKSNKSIFSGAPTEEHVCDLDPLERPPSNVSIKSATSAKSHVSVTSTKSKAFNTSFEHEQQKTASDIDEEGNLSTSNSNVSGCSKKSRCSDVVAAQSEETPNGDYSEETMQDRAESHTSVQTGCSHVSERITEDEDEQEKRRERASDTLSVEFTKSLSTVSVISVKSSESKVDAVLVKDYAADCNSIVERAASALSDKSAKSKASAQLKLSTGGKSKEESFKRVPSCMSTNSVGESGSQGSDGTLNEENTYKRSSSNTSVNLKMSSRVTNPCEGTSVDNISNEEEKAQRPPSTLSAKSAKSAKSSTSKKSCKLHISDKPGEEINVENMNHTPNNSSVKSKIPRDSNGDSNNPQTLDASPENVADFDERVDNTDIKALTPISSKSDLSSALSESEVPSVKIEEGEDRCPTATSSKSKASGRSKKSRTSDNQGAKIAKKSPSSLSVHSHLSSKSKKNNVTDVSIASGVSKKSREGGTPSDLQEAPIDTKSYKTKKSRSEGKEDADICLNKQPVICCRDSTGSDLSQTLSCSEKEICDTSSPGESKSQVSNRIVNGPLETTDTVSDKSNKGSKHKKKNMDEGDFELVPSTLPNTSPTEVVNEWLKTLPTAKDIYEMEELNENDNGVKDNTPAEEAIGTEDAEEKSEAENPNEVNGMDNVQNHNCQTITEAPNEDNTCTQREDSSKMFNSSIQVMKVLLNPKLDRCNSLPEISPVYGRKLSTSAQGLLDCLVKLQLIDHDPVKADEKNERYQELMSILQSLWLSDPSKEEHVQNTNYPHSIEEEYNHTSSSGVDVNSGSTGSGKSSDGVKSSNNVHVDESHPPNSLMMIEKGSNETEAQWILETEVKQEEDDSATDETIRSSDSPREPPKTPSSSNKSSGESSGNDEKLSKKPSQDPDPVWVLTLLNKIEKQFMTHYIRAMEELKVRWSLGDTNQLDMIIDELKTEVHKKIQISIDREVKKIKGRGGLPRPPNEPKTRTSTKQTEERMRRLRMKLQQSMDSQAEKSDSTTGTSYSDQRGENIDEYCPCEACVEIKNNSLPPLSLEVRKTAPVVMDYDLKRILLMKTAIDHRVPHGNENDTTTAETLVEKVIDGAIKEVKADNVKKIRDEAFEFTADEKEENNARQDDQGAIEETVKVLGIENNEISKASAETPGSGNGTTYTVGKKISEVETASEEGIDDAVTPGGETGSNVNIKMVEKDTTSEDDEETTEAMYPSHKYITAATTEFPNLAHDVQRKDMSEQEEKEVFLEESSSTEQETGHEEAKKDWLKLKRKLLPSVRIILQGKNSKQSVLNAENNSTVTVNEMVMVQTEKEESEDEVLVVQETTVTCEEDSSEEVERSENEDKEPEKEPAVEVCEAQTTNSKSSEDDEKAQTDEDSFSDMRSNATLSEDEKEAIERSCIATREHRSEKDKTLEETPTEILTDRQSDTEEVRDNAGTTSEQDSVEESGSTSDEDETQDENEATISELSIIEEEGASDDELSITSEAELKKMEITSVGYEEAKKNSQSESEVHTSDQEDVAVGSSVNSNDSLDGNEAATAEYSGEPDEVATTENELDVKKEAEVTRECETEMAAISDQESVHQKAKEAGQINPQEDMDDGEVIKGSSATSEDEHESETATSEHKSEKDETEEDGAITDEEKLPAITSDENEDENRDLSTEDESSEDDNKGSTTGEEISTDKETNLTQNSESKHEIAKNKNVANGMGNKECEEAGTADDETDGTASESDSAEDINSNTHDDETAEENDATNSDLSTECVINDRKDERAAEEATATNVHVFEEVEEEDALDCEDLTGKVKNRYDIGRTSEAEDDDMEDEIDADTIENKSGKDAVKEATSREGSESNDGTNEETEDKVKEEQSIETTDAEDLDTAKSSDSADDNDALMNDETSAAIMGHEINKAHNVPTEKEQVVTTGGEESDASAEADPGSPIERSLKAVSENECEEEGNSSGTDEKKSANNLTAGTGETTGQEDTSTVKDEESGGEDSENKITDATSQDYTDSNESLNQTHKDYEITNADLIETKARSEDACEGEGSDVKSGHGESENEAEDGSGEEKEPQSTEKQDAAMAGLNDSVKGSEKDDEDTDTANEGWSGSLGDSADGEDEAEEDSEPEEDTDDGQKPFVADKLRSSDVTKRDDKKTLLFPLEPLIKERDESEDGVYADIEDSETEIHSQENVTSLELTNLKR